MVARALNLCGLYLGEESDIAPAALDNPEGYWENMRFLTLNEEILQRLKGGWDLPPQVSPGWENAPEIASLRKEARSCIESLDGQRHWGWKDPRNSLTLPFWQQLLPDLKVLICVRDPYQVAQSLARRGSASQVFSMQLWQAYYERALAAAAPENRILSHYDAFFHDGKAELRRLLDFFQIDADDRTVEDACQAVKSSLRHNRGSFLTDSGSSEYPEIAELYSGLCDAAGPVYQAALHAPEEPAVEEPAAAPQVEQVGTPDSGSSRLVDDLRRRLWGNAAMIQSLQEHNDSLHQSLIASEAELAEMRRSTVFRLRSRYHRILDGLLPVSSRRRHLYDALLSGARERLPEAAPRSAAPQAGTPAQPAAQVMRTVEPSLAPTTRLTVFTICSRNFTAYAKTLFDSVRQFHPGADQYLFLCDQTDSIYESEDFPFQIVHLEELAIPGLDEMSQRYNITEFNTAIKPYAFAYLFKKLNKDQIIYLDPDILLVSPLQEVVQALDSGAECVLTPHILEPAENLEMSDIKMLQFGINNLGFLALRSTPDVQRVVDWWARQLVYGCVIDLAEGLFVDQKWADLFPAFIKRTAILHHQGYNVAYWNLPQRRVERIHGTWYSNREPLRFVHFSGNKLDEPLFFSSHSGVVTVNNIGDLKDLLKTYHERLFANGHEKYSKIPYAFSWNGASGVNLHTPKPTGQADSIITAAPLSPPADARRSTGIFARIVKARNLLRTASIRAGGWLPLARKVMWVLREGGLMALLRRAHYLRTQAEVMESMPSPLSAKPQRVTKAAAWVPRLLVIDASTPRPDRDAGGLSTFNLLKIYVDLGYDVSFIASDLAYLGAYTEAVRALGVRCLTSLEAPSVREHLRREGKNYSFIVLCRAPIAENYLADVRRFAPKAKIIFDTIDLHYLRDAREAELDGSPEKVGAARRAKDMEFGLMRKVDVTIVLSSVEKELLAKDLPEANIRLIPLIFAENPAEIPPYEERKDFLFVGGFPHKPNVDAVLYFVNEVFPLIRERLPGITFHVVGSAPPREILDLGKRDGVIVHGFVKDIAPLFNQCRLSVVPLRYGAGIKGKIATSLSYGVPVIATRVAVEGMEITPGEHVLVGDDPAEFAEAFVQAYRSEELWTRLSRAGRDQALREYSELAGYRRIASLMQEIDPNYRSLNLHTLRSFHEYENLRQAISGDLAERRSVEVALIKHDQPSFLVKGFCALCGRESTFITSFMYSYEQTDDGKPIPNWREHLACVRCGFTNRLRASMHVLNQMVRPAESASIYITEQITPLYKWLCERYPNTVGSEYFGNAIPLGSEKDGIRNEDLTALTFPAASFDYILSFDVMEHVGDDLAALREIYRCLKPGGTLLFGAPFAKNRTEKLVRARLCPDGTVEHLLPPEYHGNPVDMEHGSLCFRYFAWDLIGDMREIGFEDPRILTYWSRDFAYLGGEQFIFVGKKPG